MDPKALYSRYQELQQYVGWNDDDARRVESLAEPLAPFLPALIDDFYEEIQRHPEASKVITGGQQQIQRLKGTLLQWLRELLSGKYDANYVARRWKVGWRHVEIGLDQVYTNVALSRLRSGLLHVHEQQAADDLGAFLETRRSLNRLIDLDLAIIEDAYQAEYLARQQRTERLAAIGQVAGGIAHELRNPLNVVKTSVYYLLNARNPTPQKTEEHLTRIERHVVLADGVITALTSFARMPAPNLRPFSARRCVEEALETSALPTQVQAMIDLPDSLPPLLGDIDQIRIVFSNLIRNARDAMPEGGRLSIGGKVVDDHLEVAVSDTGVGIPAENLARIMEPLYSTKARGIGLGLAIAKTIMDRNKGTLRVSSELGRGTTFTVKLPAFINDGVKQA